MKAKRKEPDCPTATEEILRQALEKAGWRMTRQRSAVFGYLRSVVTHPTAEQVFLAVRPRIPKLSLATVYKALEALVDAGMAAKLVDQDGRALYDGRVDAHYHFRSIDTGQVLDLPIPFDSSLLNKLAPDLMERLSRQGFQVTGHRLELLGRLATPSATVHL